MYWNTIIRFVLEGYIELGLSSLLHYTILNWSKWSEVMASCIAMLFLGVVFSFPLISFLIIAFNRHSLVNHSFEHTYGAFYEGLNPNLPNRCFVTVWFCIRRSALCLTIVYLADYPCI